MKRESKRNLGFEQLEVREVCAGVNDIIKYAKSVAAAEGQISAEQARGHQEIAERAAQLSEALGNAIQYGATKSPPVSAYLEEMVSATTLIAKETVLINVATANNRLYALTHPKAAVKAEQDVVQTAIDAVDKRCDALEAKFARTANAAFAGQWS